MNVEFFNSFGFLSIYDSKQIIVILLSNDYTVWNLMFENVLFYNNKIRFILLILIVLFNSTNINQI